MEKFQILVVGSSITNLVCGALLANSGQDVMYIKIKDQKPDAGFFPEHNEKFPACEFSYDYDSGIFYELLKELHLEPAVFCEKELPMQHIVLDGNVLSCQYSWDSYKALLYHYFPEESKGLDHYFSVIEKLNDEWICMVMSAKLPDYGKIMNIVRYAKKTYTDFIYENFHNKQLIRILKQDMASKDVSLVVMAGYIMQMYHGGHLEAGQREKLKGSLISILDRSVRVIEAEYEDIRYEYCYEKQCFKIMIGECEYQSNALVMDGDPLKKFNINYDCKDRCYTVYINGKLKGQTDTGKNIYRFWNNMQGKGSDEFNYSCTAAQNSSGIQLRINVYDRDDTAVSLMAGDAVHYVKSFCGEISSYEIIREEDICGLMGWKEGQVNAWSFSPGEFNENPLTKRLLPPGLYLTEGWGRALMTAAKVTAKNVIEDCKKQVSTYGIQ